MPPVSQKTVHKNKVAKKVLKKKLEKSIFTIRCPLQPL